MDEYELNNINEVDDDGYDDDDDDHNDDIDDIVDDDDYQDDFITFGEFSLKKKPFLGFSFTQNPDDHQVK